MKRARQLPKIEEVKGKRMFLSKEKVNSSVPIIASPWEYHVLTDKYKMARNGISNWFIILNLYHKNLKPAVIEGIEKYLDNFWNGRIVNINNILVKVKGLESTMRISGEGMINDRIANYWIEKYGDYKTIKYGEKISPRFHKLIEKMRRILERRLVCEETI